MRARTRSKEVPRVQLFFSIIPFSERFPTLAQEVSELVALESSPPKGTGFESPRAHKKNGRPATPPSPSTHPPNAPRRSPFARPDARPGGRAGTGGTRALPRPPAAGTRVEGSPLPPCSPTQFSAGNVFDLSKERIKDQAGVASGWEKHQAWHPGGKTGSAGGAGGRRSSASGPFCSAFSHSCPRTSSFGAGP